MGCGGTADKNPAGNNGDSAKPAETKSGDSVSLTLRHINVRDTAKNTLALLEKVVKKTEAEVPGATFKLDGVEDTVNRDVKLKAEMAAGKPPQIFNLFGGADTQNYAKAGHLLPLNDILKELGLEDKFFELREFTVDGKIYGLPEAGFVEGFYYNTKLFADAGITSAPKTWDEFTKALEALKAKNITPIALGGGSGDGWAINMLANSLFVATAGPEAQEGFAKGTTKWTDPAVLDGFKRLKDLKDKGYIDPNVLGLKYSEGQAKFYTGQAAMLFDGSWATSAILDKDKSTVKDNVGYFRFPNIGGKGDNLINGGWSNGYGFSSHLNDAEKKAVKAFIKNFYTLEIQGEALGRDNRVPSMKGVPTPAEAAPLTKAIGEAQASAKAAFPAFDALVQPKVKVTLEQSVQELLGGQLTPEKLVEKMQKVQDEANAGKLEHHHHHH
uniref:Chitin oligosaccharide binding protein NagB2 n=1 Tax=Paenibacillus sp. FPU-7 TaxID=762821 RepID=UPI001C31EA59|nr:Chain A, Chitin oligosaccharide binding protein NagB2 [Paenibacillus sp. FPU-7]7EHO_B Chain B, Chitin oligosaccharide binding protein NagB2 [Paenibacillus sp. FPU-7]7EHQ_A Chain A, Chitin oligosaccharide binding protein NagB2 [Paenibacillus sp. FPU-7]7EHU_A Chain A, Chitin oligosaccharide binding protein NagB2 [Paenibacillus sp. FPU-7]